jgi:streptogramin lyase
VKSFAAVVAVLLAVGFRGDAQIYDTNDDVAEVFAGSGTPGYLNAQGTLAIFSNPDGVAADSFGNLYVADTGNARIRLITTNGTVSTFVGGGTGALPGYGTSVALPANFSTMICDHSNTLWVYGGYPPYGLVRITPDTYAEFLSFSVTLSGGLCVDSSNNLYYSTSTQIYRLGANGTLDVFAGSGNTASQNGNGIYASFSSPRALAADEAGNIYVWDSGNGLIRRIDQGQNVTTIAGPGPGGNVDGVGTAASFSTINSMQADDFGNVFLACGSCVRKIDASTNVWTVAGSFSQSSYANGAGAISRFNGASDLCLSQGMIFVADSGNERIRSISFNPVAQPVTGPNLGIATYAGVTVTGFVGRTYQIQASTDMTNWNTVATLLLNSSPYLWFDTSSVAGNRFYRAFLLP